jgi:hypothetical protein
VVIADAIMTTGLVSRSILLSALDMAAMENVWAHGRPPQCRAAYRLGNDPALFGQDLGPISLN